MTPASVYLTRAAVRDRTRDARYHWTRSVLGRPAVTICGGQVVALEGGRAPSDVPVLRRCLAAGCRDRWGGVDTPADLFTTQETPDARA